MPIKIKVESIREYNKLVDKLNAIHLNIMQKDSIMLMFNKIKIFIDAEGGDHMIRLNKNIFTIDTIIFGYYFDAKIESLKYCNIKTLIFNIHFNQILPDLPPTLKCIKFLDYNERMITFDDIDFNMNDYKYLDNFTNILWSRKSIKKIENSNIKYLSLNTFFRSKKLKKFPDTLKYLYFSISSYRYTIRTLPDKLKYLVANENINISAQLPTNLKKLAMYDFNDKITTIPESVKYIKIDSYHGKITNILPPKIKTLILDRPSIEDIRNIEKLQHLKYISLSSPVCELFILPDSIRKNRVYSGVKNYKIIPPNCENNIFKYKYNNIWGYYTIYRNLGIIIKYYIYNRYNNIHIPFEIFNYIFINYGFRWIFNKLIEN